MKLNKQNLIRLLCAQTLICSLLSALFSGKKKTLSSIFAGLSIAGALANLAVVFSGKCCCNKLAVADDFDDLDDEELDDGDIFCDFEDDCDCGCEDEPTEESDETAVNDTEEGGEETAAE